MLAYFAHVYVFKAFTFIHHYYNCQDIFFKLPNMDDEEQIVNNNSRSESPVYDHTNSEDEFEIIPKNVASKSVSSENLDFELKEKEKHGNKNIDSIFKESKSLEKIANDNESKKDNITEADLVVKVSIKNDSFETTEKVPVDPTIKGDLKLETKEEKRKAGEEKTKEENAEEGKAREENVKEEKAEKVKEEKAKEEKAKKEKTREEKTREAKEEFKVSRLVCVVILFSIVSMISFRLIENQMSAAIQDSLNEDLQPQLHFSKSLGGLQMSLCVYYGKNNFMTNIVPWSNDSKSAVNISDFYINQTFHLDKFYSNNILDFFSWDTNGKSKSLAFVAEQGEGKTTAVKQTLLSWCQGIQTYEHQHNQKITIVLPHISKFESKIYELMKPYFLRIFEFWLQSMLEKSIEEFKRKENLVVIHHDLVLYHTYPDLILAYEFKELCGRFEKFDSLLDVVWQMDEGQTRKKDIENILGTRKNKILVVFDGYDEEFHHCKGRQMEDVGRIIKKEDTRKFNLMVTTRPWKLKWLVGYQTIKFKQEWNETLRNLFIKNFFNSFGQWETNGLSDRMILALNNEKNIVSKDLQSSKRMLLYLCHIWKNANENPYPNPKILFQKKELFDQLWEQMMWTYNIKYPEKKIDKNKLKEIRKTIGEIHLEKYHPKAEEYEEKYGKEFFYLGIHTISVGCDKSNGIGCEIEEEMVEPVPSSDILVKEEKIKAKKKADRIEAKIAEEAENSKKMYYFIFIVIISSILIILTMCCCCPT